MVENQTNDQYLVNASKEDLIKLLSGQGISDAQQIDFPTLPSVESLRGVKAEVLEITRLKCHLAKMIQQEDEWYAHEYSMENPNYFKNVKNLEKFLKGWGF